MELLSCHFWLILNFSISVLITLHFKILIGSKHPTYTKTGPHVQRYSQAYIFHFVLVSRPNILTVFFPFIEAHSMLPAQNHSAVQLYDASHSREGLICKKYSNLLAQYRGMSLFGLCHLLVVVLRIII